MSKIEMLERSRKALADFDRLHPEMQLKQLVAWGVIDPKGEVLFGHRAAENGEQPSPADGHRPIL